MKIAFLYLLWFHHFASLNRRAKWFHMTTRASGIFHAVAINQGASMKNRIPHFLFAAVVASVALLPDLAASMPITRQVTIRAIGLCDDAGANCADVNTYEAAADAIWAQAGVDFKFLPTLTWNQSQFLTPDYSVGEELSLFAAGTIAFGDSTIDHILNMYFVKDLLPTNRLYGEGCGAPIFVGFCGNAIGIVINTTLVNAFNGGLGRIDTVAHEVGHVLGLTHGGFGAGAGVPDNLMTSGSFRSPAETIADINPNGLGLDKLTQAQIDEVYKSIYVKDLQVPEPSGVALLCVALAGLLWQQRRRAASGVA